MKGFKSSHYHILSGGLGCHLLDHRHSGIHRPQYDAMSGMLEICGMIHTKIVDPAQQTVKQSFVVRNLVKCEIYLPLYTCKIVRHIILHFYEVGGWCDDLAVAPPLSK